MSRIVTTSLVAASALLVSGCVADEEPPAPSLADQLRATGGPTEGDGPSPRPTATPVPEGDRVVVGEVAIAVAAVDEGSQAQLSIDTPDEVVEGVELAIGQSLEIGGYRVTLAATDGPVAQVVVHGPDATPM